MMPEARADVRVADSRGLEHVQGHSLFLGGSERRNCLLSNFFVLVSVLNVSLCGPSTGRCRFDVKSLFPRISKRSSTLDG